MNLSKKIEEIQKKPEHIRLRWIWGLTLFFTLCVIFIWGITIKIQSEASRQKRTLTPEEQIFLNEFQNQKKSLQDMTKNMGEIYQENPEEIQP